MLSRRCDVRYRIVAQLAATAHAAEVTSKRWGQAGAPVRQCPGPATVPAWIVRLALERAPAGGQIGFWASGFSEREPMAKHRSHSIVFKRQIAQEFIAGETLHGLAKRHDL